MSLSGASNVPREDLEHEAVPLIDTLRREARWDDTGHQVGLVRPWNSKSRGYQVPWRTHKSDEEMRFDLEPHPQWVATSPGTRATTFDRPPAFFDASFASGRTSPNLSPTLRYAQITDPADDDSYHEELQTETKLNAQTHPEVAAVHASAAQAAAAQAAAAHASSPARSGRSMGRSPSSSHLRLAPMASGVRTWNDRFINYRELDRSPTRDGIRLGLNNRLGIMSSSFSTTRRVDSAIQRYATGHAT